MERSLKLYTEKNKQIEGIIRLNSSRQIYKIFVRVDGETDNQSFMVETYGDWYTYTIERVYDNDVWYSVIKLNVSKNLNPLNRLGEIKVRHTAANIVIYLDISQDGEGYSINIKRFGDEKKLPEYIFNRFPKDYEEIEFIVESNGGSKRWCVKSIEQYEESENITNETKTQRVPYNNIFSYRSEGNKLIVRSYGEINMGNDTFYRFIIGHRDNMSVIDSIDIRLFGIEGTLKNYIVS